MLEVIFLRAVVAIVGLDETWTIAVYGAESNRRAPRQTRQTVSGRITGLAAADSFGAVFADWPSRVIKSINAVAPTSTKLSVPTLNARFTIGG